LITKPRRTWRKRRILSSAGAAISIFLSSGNPGAGAASPRQLPVVLFWRNKESFMRYTADQFRQSYVDCRMKILVLTKRQYMGKDLLDDRFGRFRELPLELARLDHQVHGLCLSYRARNEAQVID